MSASSNRGGYAGLAVDPMHDLIFNATTSAHITQADGLAFIQADLGENKTINHIDLAAPDRALDGGGAAALDGAQVQYSQNAVAWTDGPIVGGATAGIYKTVSLGGVSARYVRIVKAGAPVGLGDFRLYATPKLSNNAPVAVKDIRAKLNAGETTTFDPRLNDTDVDRHELTITSVSPAAHGQTSFTGTSITHVPDPGFKGTDTFTYTITDDRGGFATGTVELTYSTFSSPNENHDPIAIDDGGPTARIEIPYAAGFNTPYIRVLENDSDPDGDPLSIVSAGPVQHGLLSINEGVIRYFPIADQFTGFEDFPYTISDGKGGTATGRIWVRIGNTYPQTTADYVSTYQNHGLIISPLDNDHDAENDPLTIGAFSQPAHGNVSKFGDTLLVYTPNHDYVGPDSFTYNANDDHGGGGGGNIFIDVKAGSPNNAPIARNDFSAASPASVPNDMPVKMMVLSNDTDPDNDPITISSFSQPAHGTLQRITTYPEHLQYRATPGYLGPDSFNYTISDGRGGTSTATAYLNVIFEYNSPPVATDDSFTVANYRSEPLPVSANDYDAQADDRTIVSVTQPAHGSVVITGSAVANGAMITYTPTAGYVGPDSFTYTITDGRGTYDTATVSLTVLASRPPVAVNDAVMGRHNKTVALGGLLANDTDPDGDSLNFVSFTQPSHGVVTSLGSYYLGYTPTTDYVGVDSFTYTITDGQGGTSTATVTITVPPEPPPVATADSYTMDFNTTATFDVMANDSDPDGDAFSLTAVGAPGHGTASIVSGKIRYVPTRGFSGSDSFTYTVSDGKGGVGTGNVSVTIVRNSNQPPAAVSDDYTTPANTAKSLTPLANDIDADGDVLVVTSIGTPAHGAATITENGASILYTPQTSYAGTDTFSYTISDANGGVASGQISVTTLPTPNRNPKPVNDTTGLMVANTTATIPVLANDGDPDGDSLTLASVGAPAHGTATAVGQTITYTPTANYSGPDSFTYTVSDGHGGTATATVNAVITTNRPPVVRDYGPFTVNSAAMLPVYAVVSDPDYDPITLTAIGTPPHGTAVLNAPSFVTYTPPTNYSGADTFSYTVSDGRGGTATANVLVYVANPAGNNPPRKGDGYATVEQDIAAELSMEAANPDRVTFTYTVITPPAHGTVSAIDGWGQLVYRPTTGYVGPDSIKIRITDGRGGTATVTLYITVVQSAARRPVVVNDGPFTTAFNTPITLTTLLSNDSDPEGEPLTIVGVSQGVGGRAALINGNTVVFVPDNNFTGSNASFSYYVTDGKTKPIQGTVTINVLPPSP